MPQSLAILVIFLWAALASAPSEGDVPVEGSCVHDDSHAQCREQTNFGDAHILDSDILSHDTGSAFDIHIHFDLQTSPAYPHLAKSARGFVYTNGNLGGSCEGKGQCSIAIQDLPAGFYEVRTLVVDSNWLISAQDAFECAERHQGCRGLLALQSYKVNFFHVTLLSAVVDPFSPLLEQPDMNLNGRPLSLIVENTYEVNDEGDTLSDLLLSNGGRSVTFVSPLVPRGDEIGSMQSSTWECRFRSSSQATAGEVQSDGAHTFRVSCPVPESLWTQAPVEVEVFRDGADIAPHSEFRSAAPLPPTSTASRSASAAVEICTMMRNEAAFVVEWVEYHLMLGVAHIHIYLHLTTDDAALRLEPYVKRGWVTLRAWDFNWSPMYMRFQSHAWNDCSARRGAAGLPVWVSILDVDEFLVPAAGEPDIAGTVHMLAARGGGPSALKLAWLPYSSREEDEAEAGSSLGLTVERFRWHAGSFVPEVGRMVGDQQHGKVTFRADHSVHLDFAGHKATIAPAGIAEADPAALHIAHYMGRPRSYSLPDQRHEEEARRRRRVAEEEGMVRWRMNPLCGLGARLRRHLCARDPEEFAEAGALCAALGEGRDGAVRECEESGEEGRFVEAAMG